MADKNPEVDLKTRLASVADPVSNGTYAGLSDNAPLFAGERLVVNRYLFDVKQNCTVGEIKGCLAHYLGIPHYRLDIFIAGEEPPEMVPYARGLLF